MLSPLQKILASFRSASVTEREKGTYFEELCRTYFRYEAFYADLFENVWTYSEWAKENGLDGHDTGIDLVAKARNTDDLYAIQCKFYGEEERISKKDIDSFLASSGQAPFTHRLFVSTTENWSDNAYLSLGGQHIPVSLITLRDLENSQIDWADYAPNEKPTLKPKYDPKKHQQTAINNVLAGLKSADRGKLIMACGTGKTFTSLKIAEEMVGKNGRVLFLVPSLSLLSQSLTEWTQQSKTPLHSFAVCSDSEVGKKRKRDEDIVQTFAHELNYPATTDAKRLAFEMKAAHDAQHMSVVFSTYHSIQVVSEAQHLYDLDDFDLIICDEAHRTTGSKYDNEDESNFVKVHDAEFLRAKKRVYMTATPRIFGDHAKIKAETEGAALFGMDDEALFGKQLHVITFSEAVSLDLLTDYKVIVLAVDEDHVNARLQKLLSDDNNSLKVDDAARIVGCWKALSKQQLSADLADDADPMRRAVAFCQVIEPGTGKTRGGHKVSSKQIAGMFQKVVEAYQAKEDDPVDLVCEVDHIDGSMNAAEKESKIQWLKDEPPNDDTCRILSNVRCLSEGVDVPALDAVLFLTPRSSAVDVVQSVGRVMRKAEGKQLGYVILPVVIPAGMEPHEALDDNKVYKVVWEVLQALRSHDDRFDAMVNKINYTGHDPSKMEVIAITDKLSSKKPAPGADGADGTGTPAAKGTDASGHTIGTPEDKRPKEVQTELAFHVGELERALYAKVVKKCGTPNYWEKWAADIAKIARTHISRIQAIVSDPKNEKEVAAFKNFADELRDDLNDSITDEEVIEMLAQHLITRPVFDALFQDYSFAKNNPVSTAMQSVLDILQEHRLEKEADTLEKFYASVQMRASNIDSAAGKQKIVVDLYDKFFKGAFPKMTERLGIVYTPVEVVDFIIHSINDLLQSEFGQTLGSKGVHIIDPFTGTGTFITRLLQSGLIRPDQLPHKYKEEIHANEIVLLAYYIAAINIEAVYHGIVGGDYTPFEGICLTDTFQMYESEDLISDKLANNSDRRKRQKELDIRVIMGNPPYSAGQTSENDNNQNVAYPDLDSRIRNSYVEESSAKLHKGLYDSYVRSFRWASDQLGQDSGNGIIGFVSNASYLDANTADGMRKCLAKEFDSIYVFNLRGNQRTSGERSRKEGGKIFGSGSRAPIAITFLVKNPSKQKGLFEEGEVLNRKANIQWYEIGDYLSQREKLDLINSFGSVDGIRNADEWGKIVPNRFGDWINQRDEKFYDFIVAGEKDSSIRKKVFRIFSLGIITNRDAWCYNSSSNAVSRNISRMLATYNKTLSEFNREFRGLSSQDRRKKIDKFVPNDPSEISWTANLKQELSRDHQIAFDSEKLVKSTYRPFFKQWLYYDRKLNERVYRMPRIFPFTGESNKVIGFSASESRSDFSVMIFDCMPSLHATDMVGSQYLPLYRYSVENSGNRDGESSEGQDHLFKDEGPPKRRDGISDEGLAHFQKAYPGHESDFTKEDLFFYVYGLLLSPDYRTRYANNLGKDIPRIPAVKQFADFQAFSQAGRDLAHWHLDYETVAMHPGIKLKINGDRGDLGQLTAKDFRVEKMKFAKRKDPETGKSVPDKTTVIYNPRITMTNIPLEAYEYVVNGKPALEWVMERQAVSTDKKSGIVNDANDWATETMGNPRYPLELFQRVVTVSLETRKIVNALPALKID